MPLSPPTSAPVQLSQLTPALATSSPPRGALAETFDRQAAGAIISISSGVPKFTTVRLVQGVTYSSITFFSRTTALAAGVHQFFGLYDDDLGSSSGTALALLRGSVDDGATAWGADTKKTLALTSAYTAVRTGIHYVCVLVEAGTAPTLAGIAGSSIPDAVAPIVAGSAGSGLSALPNPSGALTVSGNAAYAYLS